jgi:hypothetical protein
MLAGLAVASLMAWFYLRVGADGRVFDGLGREVFEAPFLLRIVDIDHWRGPFWFVVDIVGFWTILGIGLVLAGWGFGRRN